MPNPDVLSAYNAVYIIKHTHRGLYTVRLHMYNIFNQLSPSDAIWQWYWSTMAQIMAWCLTAPSHYLIRDYWHTSECNFRENWNNWFIGIISHKFGNKNHAENKYSAVQLKSRIGLNKFDNFISNLCIVCTKEHPLHMLNSWLYLKNNMET